MPFNRFGQGIPGEVRTLTGIQSVGLGAAHERQGGGNVELFERLGDSHRRQEGIL